MSFLRGSYKRFDVYGKSRKSTHKWTFKGAVQQFSGVSSQSAEYSQIISFIFNSLKL